MAKFLLLVLLSVTEICCLADGVQSWSYQRVAQSAISESQAIQIALRSVPGKVLSAQLSDSDGRKAYKVKILSNDGRVRTVNVDAENGRII